MDLKQAGEKQLFRSIIKRYYSPELLLKLDLIAGGWGCDNNTKVGYVREELDHFHVPYIPLGRGTNRYGIMVDGYAMKIALDRAGKIDNRREFKYSKILYPRIIKTYEGVETGVISTSEYITPLTPGQYEDPIIQSRMRKILSEITSEFLVGDVGVSSINYANWGLRYDDTLAILDYAYIYSLSYRGFKCTCEDEGMLAFDNDYNYLVCPFCHRKWSFEDIRRRISIEDEEKEIGNIMKCGYNINKDGTVLPVNPNFSMVYQPKKKKKKEKKKDPVNDIFQVSSYDQGKILADLNKEIDKERRKENKMVKLND